MKVGIDSYSFHRNFGEVYQGLQGDPGIKWDMTDDFLEFAGGQEVDEVALDTWAFPVDDAGYVAELRARVDEMGFDRVVGWGHPDGLRGGTDEGALEELKGQIPVARRLGAGIMRIVASSKVYVDEPREPQIRNTVRMLKEAVEVADANGVVLAIENHIDFTSGEILQILEGVDSESLAVNFDTGNALRMFEDPVEAARRLAPYTVSTHTKDIAARRGGSPADRFVFWPSCPVGQGLVDMPAVVEALAEGGFSGALGVELDLLAPRWADRPEEELVAESVSYLRDLTRERER